MDVLNNTNTTVRGENTAINELNTLAYDLINIRNYPANYLRDDIPEPNMTSYGTTTRFPQTDIVEDRGEFVDSSSTHLYGVEPFLLCFHRSFIMVCGK